MRRLLVVALMLLATSDAHAATFIVLDPTEGIDVAPGDGVCSDGGVGAVCTLRAAVMEANALPGPDFITVPAGRYELSRFAGPIRITDQVTILGVGGDVRIEGDGVIPGLFEVDAGPGRPVELDRLKLRGAVEGAIEVMPGSELLLVRSELSLSGTGLVNRCGDVNVDDTQITSNLEDGVYSAAMDGEEMCGPLPRVVITSGAVVRNGGIGLRSICGEITVNGAARIIENEQHGIENLGLYEGLECAAMEPVRITSGPRLARVVVTSGALVARNRGRGVRNTCGAFTLTGASVVSGNEGGGIESHGAVGELDCSALAKLEITSGSSVVDNVGRGVENLCGSVLLRDASVSGNSAAGLWSFAEEASCTEEPVLLLFESTIDSNEDGGIFHGLGLLEIFDSVIHSNTAERGAGISAHAGTVRIVNSTVSSNVATDSGGGIELLSEGDDPTELFLSGVTIARNRATQAGGGIVVQGAVARARNAIIADNSAASASDCAGELSSEGYLLVQSPLGCAIDGDIDTLITARDPLLGPLQDNGGATVTHALLTGSPAINAGNPARPGSGGTACEEVDQLGMRRGVCDIGAFESAVVCGDGVPEFDEQCDDGNAQDGDCCTASCALVAAQTPCTDGDACTDADVCDDSGTCLAGPPLVCDDELFCNGEESCDSQIGCLAGEAPDPNDGVVCTEDLCDENADQLVNTPVDVRCDNGLFCDGVELCHATLDCVPGPPPPRGDGVSCTDDLCDEAADRIVHVPLDADCDNDLFCDGLETCDAVRDCQVGEPPLVDDGIACTDDSCREDLDVVVHEPVDARCDDGLFCDGEERCEPDAGCVDGEPLAVRDDDPCTADYCDEVRDQVSHVEGSPLCEGLGVAIDFDDRGAACSFSQSEPLAGQYAHMGVTWESAGAVLDQCGSFGVSDFSPTNFAAYNGRGRLEAGIDVRNFDVVHFSAPVDSVEFRVGGKSSSTLSAVAFDENDAVVDEVMLLLRPALQTLKLEGEGIVRVAYGNLTSGDRTPAFVLDDLRVPEPSGAVLRVAALLVLALMSRARRRG